jgi:Outer membrane protein beta-barrel domain
MRQRFAPPVLLILLGIPAAPALAQEDARPPVEHRGFWIGFGAGGGMNFADFAEGSRAGVGGYVRLGGTVSPKILLGGEASGWGRDIGGGTFSESGGMAVVLFYPAGPGAFLKAGAGFAGWAVSTSVGSTTTTTTAGGFAGTLGIGYDLRIGTNLFLTPNLDFLYHTLESDNTAFASISAGAVLLFTLGLTWH